QLIPSYSSSFCEGARTAVSRIMTGAGLYIGGPSYEVMFYFYVGNICAMALVIVLYFVRRRIFI
uniref:hypothetical protein n=1 Tax=Acinetobacter baumannii TaxID=470 RepID=UPI001C0749AB